MWGEDWHATAADGGIELRQLGLEPSCSNMEMGESGRQKGERTERNRNQSENKTTRKC